MLHLSKIESAVPYLTCCILHECSIPYLTCCTLHQCSNPQESNRLCPILLRLLALREVLEFVCLRVHREGCRGCDTAYQRCREGRQGDCFHSPVLAAAVGCQPPDPRERGISAFVCVCVCVCAFIHASLTHTSKYKLRSGKQNMNTHTVRR